MTGGPLQALIALQDVDTALDQLRHRRSHLPERLELAAIEQELAGLDQATGAAGIARDQVAEQQAQAEAELAAIEGRAEAVNRRLYGGTVTASRELQAMAADVESFKARASVVEDQVLELMEVREPLEAELGALSVRREALDARRQAGVTALSGRRSRRGRGAGPSDRRPGPSGRLGACRSAGCLRSPPGPSGRGGGRPTRRQPL